MPHEQHCTQIWRAASSRCVLALLPLAKISHLKKAQPVILNPRTLTTPRKRSASTASHTSLRAIINLSCTSASGAMPSAPWSSGKTNKKSDARLAFPSARVPAVILEEHALQHAVPTGKNGVLKRTNAIEADAKDNPGPRHECVLCRRPESRERRRGRHRRGRSAPGRRPMGRAFGSGRRRSKKMSTTCGVGARTAREESCVGCEGGRRGEEERIDAVGVG